ECIHQQGQELGCLLPDLVLKRFVALGQSCCYPLQPALQQLNFVGGYDFRQLRAFFTITTHIRPLISKRLVEDVTDLERRRRITRWIYKSTASPWKSRHQFGMCRKMLRKTRIYRTPANGKKEGSVGYRTNQPDGICRYSGLVEAE